MLKKTKALLNSSAGLFLCLGILLGLGLFSCSAKQTTHQYPDTKILKRGNGAEVETLDPQLIRSESAGNVARDLYEGLLTEAADGSLVPGVAVSWTYDPETLCYRFDLRPEAKWSNGDRVSAQDFVRGMQYALDVKNNSPYRELLNSIIKLEAISTVELHLCTKHAVPYFLELLALPVSFPRHAVSAAKAPVSNGAYRLSDWAPQEKIVLTKNPHFHAADTVYFEQVEIVTTEDPASELKRFLAGELDITVTVPPGDVPRLKQQHSEALRIAPVLNSYFYGFNLSRPPFQNKPELREALSLAIDREVLADKVLGSGEQAAWTLVPPGMPDYTSPETKYANLPPAQRQARAQKLYADAGYSADQPLQIQLRYNTSTVHKKIAVAVASMWKQTLGVKVDLYNEEWKVFLDNRRQKNTQVFRSGWIADVNDASNYLELFSAAHPLNDYAYHKLEFERLLESAKTASSERTSILQAAEKQLLDDHAIIPLYFYVSKHMVNPEIKGWINNSLDHHPSRFLFRTSH
ncbi:MAG: peptide ABC transporter substrate-binding protein [Gammaproteobacteria bacterium]|nr:peptide ABC transporter substrate-binding protein [Gammaproteobacteria bacterium]NNC96982.1 peptide ABC transporter substrate-binding protein [Gammaproteobacteria bacterium]NNM13427.1 peptide ABC transporter substrate-binding protein [Gammaproteobacteria bacterium]